MHLCFDATRFGFGLGDVVELAAFKSVPSVECTFEPFELSAREAKSLSRSEKDFLAGVSLQCRERGVSIALINLNFCLDASDRAARKRFTAMVAKMALVARALDCPRLAFWLAASRGDGWLADATAVLAAACALTAERDLRLLLKLSTPPDYRQRSLRDWRLFDPADLRHMLAACPGLSLSFSPGDWLWMGLDYLALLPAFLPAIEHVEVRDVEVNQSMLKDGGLFGPLWWRYRLCGRGQVDWRQLIEALKLYGYGGPVSLSLDDEFVGAATMELDAALDAGLDGLRPLVDG